MKPAPFTYYCPSSLQHALELVAEYGLEAKVLAGGQSLVPLLNMRLSAPGSLIDINRVSELDYIRYEDGRLKLGALTRQRTVETSELVRKYCPLLVESTRFIGHVQTRNRGTLGGSVVHADPTAELPLSLVALDATVVVQSLERVREMPVTDFFLTYLTTDLQPDELLIEVQIPVETTPMGYAFEEYSRRHGDFALVAAACLMDVGEDGIIARARIVLGGIDAVPYLAQSAMDVICGRKLSEDVVEDAAELAVQNVEVEADFHASREYRIHLAKSFLKRTIHTAYQRASAQNGGA